MDGLVVRECRGSGEVWLVACPGGVWELWGRGGSILPHSAL